MIKDYDFANIASIDILICRLVYLNGPAFPPPLLNGPAIKKNNNLFISVTSLRGHSQRTFLQYLILHIYLQFWAMAGGISGLGMKRFQTEMALLANCKRGTSTFFQRSDHHEEGGGGGENSLFFLNLKINYQSIHIRNYKIKSIFALCFYLYSSILTISSHEFK